MVNSKNILLNSTHVSLAMSLLAAKLYQSGFLCKIEHPTDDWPWAEAVDLLRTVAPGEIALADNMVQG